MRGYAICCTPRSGSNYLSALFGSTGVLGHPLEWFNAPSIRRGTSIANWPDDPAEQLARIPEFGATPNGVYGLKLFPWQFDQVAAAGVAWAEALPGLAFVHLTRRDVLGQAISYARAAQSDAWTAAEQPRRAPVYDGEAIAARLREIAGGDARWRYWFGAGGIEPLRLTYEDDLALWRRERTVRLVAELVGVADPRIDPAAIDVHVQRDAATEDWRARFIAERGERARL